MKPYQVSISAKYSQFVCVKAKNKKEALKKAKSKLIKKLLMKKYLEFDVKQLPL